jgi:ABC-2 type transport system ATP-binding protein
VEVFGHDLDREPNAVKSCIGLVPQEFNCNQFEPLVEVVMNQAGYYGIPRSESYGLAMESLERVDLGDKARETARQLSGGMRRRLMIARALAHRPQLLILDEPTAGVDVEIRHSMWEQLRELNRQGTTIILTTHYLEEAEQLCRNIAIINQGHIVERRGMDELLYQLHTETFVLNIGAGLSELPQIDGYRMEQLDECTLEVEVSRDRGMNGLFEALSRSGIEVISMRNKQNRLEKLFIDMVDAGRNGVEDE